MCGTGWYLVVLGQYGAVLVGTWCYKLSHETSTGHPTLLKPFILQLLSENQMLYFGFKNAICCFALWWVYWLLISIEYTCATVVHMCSKALTSRSLHVCREFCRLMWTLRLWNIRLDFVIKPLKSTVKGMECFKLIKSHIQSHSYTRQIFDKYLMGWTGLLKIVYFPKFYWLKKISSLFQLHDVIWTFLFQFQLCNISLFKLLQKN